MPLNNFIRSGMDTELANTGGNAQSSFRGSDERKALKAAKVNITLFESHSSGSQ